MPDLRGGGVEHIRLVLAKEFARRGHRVEFVLLQARGELLAKAEALFSVHDLACERIRYLPLALARYLRHQRPDALIAAMWPLTVIAPVARLLSGHSCTLIVSEHAILSAQYAGWGSIHRFLLRSSTAIGYRLADACIGVSRGVADDMQKLSLQPAGLFTVVHNPMRSQRCPSTRQLAEAEALWGQGGPRILTVGSLKPVKNHALLLHAFSRLVNHASARLMLLGQGQQEASLRALASELGVAGRVVFVGFQPDPTPFYHTADLFVLSSDHEGFGNVIVEALSCGTPIVSTACPSGPAEILNNGEYGFLVPVGDDAALADAMAASLQGEHPRERLIARAGCFSPSVAADKYLELLS
ncbi:glycosyltransferase [Halomonas stenophila]|uniref:glycosyltransferase n=1 Tax=Halomonas stenophila TaxID=795312 RepID=UPI001FE5F9B6|nr:glycosyltransferase [Halomonas stenophila]